MNQLLEEKYKELGISEKVYAFGEKIEQEDTHGAADTHDDSIPANS